MGAGNGSDLRHPLRAQPLVDNFQEVEQPWGARSATCAQNEGTKLTSGATSRSRVKHPLWKQSDLTYPHAFLFF
ncbi:hypothetical protein F2Q68_00008912 [Brassica cretica]|uniref:Uncharacterized protein n=1 Tax=Brassica cretica TaxID=69181 RepID=A0A8S9L564_BRACR|nr:hypothetical protein F2Q68_00008912 [Brassica cretica]